MKVLKIIRSIFVWLMVALAACMMIFTIVSVSTFDRADRNLFGYKAFIVLSDSMKATDFDAGDLVLVKEVDCSTLKEGDIISYTSQNTSNYGETVTHKIRKLTTDANGEPGFVTYGTTTDTDDETIVTYPYVLGKYQSHIPKIGTFFQFLKTTPGYIYWPTPSGENCNSMVIPKEFAYNNIPLLTFTERANQSHIMVYDENIELIKSFDIDNEKVFTYSLTYQKESRDVTNVSEVDLNKQDLNKSFTEWLNQEKLYDSSIEQALIITKQEKIWQKQ